MAIVSSSYADRFCEDSKDMPKFIFAGVAISFSKLLHVRRFRELSSKQLAINK